MPKITNVRWGLDRDPDDPQHKGQPCLYFDVDGRPASAFWEQTNIVKHDLLFIDFLDDAPSHLPTIPVIEDGREVTKSDRFIHSAWLVKRMAEMCAAKDFEDGRVIGDEPEGE
jgi:hypothetical protein